MYGVNPEFWLTNQRLISQARRNSLLAGGDISNALPVRAGSQTFHLFPKLSKE
jgi:hypothetical protein